MILFVTSLGRTIGQSWPTLRGLVCWPFGSEAGNASALFLIASAIVMVWTTISILVIKGHSKENTLQADQYVAYKNRGWNLIFYLDEIEPLEAGFMYRMLRKLKPANDDRVAALQISTP